MAAAQTRAYKTFYPVGEATITCGELLDKLHDLRAQLAKAHPQDLAFKEGGEANEGAAAGARAFPQPPRDIAKQKEESDSDPDEEDVGGAHAERAAAYVARRDALHANVAVDNAADPEARRVAARVARQARIAAAVAAARAARAEARDRKARAEAEDAARKARAKNPPPVSDASGWALMTSLGWANSCDVLIPEKTAQAAVAAIHDIGNLKAWMELQAARAYEECKGLAGRDKNSVFQLMALGRDMFEAALVTPDILEYALNGLQAVDLAAIVQNAAERVDDDI